MDAPIWLETAQSFRPRRINRDKACPVQFQKVCPAHCSGDRSEVVPGKRIDFLWLFGNWRYKPLDRASSV